MIRFGWSAESSRSALLPPTATVLAKYAKSNRVAYRVEEVRDGEGAKLHWMGDLEAKKVILYFHGVISHVKLLL